MRKAGKSRATILVVDDDFPVRLMIRTTLAGAGYRVLDAGNARDAAFLMRSHRGSIDALIVDIVMPGMSGLDFGNQVGLTHPGSEILYISGFHGSVAVESICRKAPENILPKPFTGAELLSRVKEMVR
jgi:DNA-binding response OmpR family regulator